MSSNSIPALSQPATTEVGAPRPNRPISQFDLEQVAILSETYATVIGKILKRIRAGATVEEGRLHFDCEEYAKLTNHLERMRAGEAVQQ